MLCYVMLCYVMLCYVMLHGNQPWVSDDMYEGLTDWKFISIIYNLKLFVFNGRRNIKDAMPVSFRSELFTSYFLTIFKQ